MEKPQKTTPRDLPENTTISELVVGDAEQTETAKHHAHSPDFIGKLFFNDKNNSDIFKIYYSIAESKSEMMTFIYSVVEVFLLAAGLGCFLGLWLIPNLLQKINAGYIVLAVVFGILAVGCAVFAVFYIAFSVSKGKQVKKLKSAYSEFFSAAQEYINSTDTMDSEIPAIKDKDYEYKLRRKIPESARWFAYKRDERNKGGALTTGIAVEVILLVLFGLSLSAFVLLIAGIAPYHFPMLVILSILTTILFFLNIICHCIYDAEFIRYLCYKHYLTIAHAYCNTIINNALAEREKYLKSIKE